MKGLLTYRTIQFSMSSGCYHPKNHFKAVFRSMTFYGFDLCPWRAATFIHFQRTKNPRGRFILPNSATQTLVKFAASLS
jgi:hypothetical protein